jgi:hypothetical protein
MIFKKKLEFWVFWLRLAAQSQTGDIQTMFFESIRNVHQCISASNTEKSKINKQLFNLNRPSTSGFRLEVIFLIRSNQENWDEKNQQRPEKFLACSSKVLC